MVIQDAETTIQRVLALRHLKGLGTKVQGRLQGMMSD